MRTFHLIAVFFALISFSFLSNAQKMSDTIVYNDTLTAVKGDSLKIRIVDNPSTGYRWSYLENSGKGFVKFVAEDFEAPTTQLIGAPGTRIFIFKVRKPGQIVVKFYKHRGDQAPIETQNYLIIIKKNCKSSSKD